MIGYTEKIKEISKRLLEECKVDMVVGFRKGTVPMMNEPCFVKDSKEVESLVWDCNCGINLANYLTGRKEKIGISLTVKYLSFTVLIPQSAIDQSAVWISETNSSLLLNLPSLLVSCSIAST